MTPLPPADCISLFLQQAQRLSIEVRWTRDGMTQLDAAYHARPGEPGLILLHDRTPRPDAQKICTLLTHEMVHVLQHWKGNLEALPPLGWPVHNAPPGRNLSRQEQEAYTAQIQPNMVLNSVRLLKPVSTQLSP